MAGFGPKNPQIFFWQGLKNKSGLNCQIFLKQFFVLVHHTAALKKFSPLSKVTKCVCCFVSLTLCTVTMLLTFTLWLSVFSGSHQRH